MLKDYCERADAFACYKLGKMYEKRQLLFTDLRQAEVYYRKACSMDPKWGCEEVSRLQGSKDNSRPK